MNYDDIIALPRPKSKHPKMSQYDRAAQFAPFSALTGYKESIEEASRQVDVQRELSEEEVTSINSILSHIKNSTDKNILLKITYFVKDPIKKGGSYQMVSNKLKYIDEANGVLVLADFTKISFVDIAKIEILSEDMF